MTPKERNQLREIARLAEKLPLTTVGLTPAIIVSMLDSLDTAERALSAASGFIANGRELGYINMPDDPLDPAHHVPIMVNGALRRLV